MNENSSKELTIVIGGDVSPTLRNQVLFERGDSLEIFNDLLKELLDADLSVVNLETPLIKTISPIEKIGPILGAPEACVNGLIASGIGCLSLANNHILDHGEMGLLNTIRVCRKAGLKLFGAGANLEEASKIQVALVKGFKVGLLGAADREFSTAGKNLPGSNPIDAIGLWWQLKDQKDYDVLITLLHAGVSGYPFPSPRLQKLCRFLVDLGVHLVICQHSHCPGCIEEYGHGLIIYGQGNLIFDWEPNPGGSWCEGFLVQVVFSRSGISSYRLIPYFQSRKDPGAHKIVEPDGSVFLKKIMERSESIRDEEFVKKEWTRFCSANSNDYFAAFHGNRFHHRIIRRVCNELGVKWKPISQHRSMIIGNFIRSEDHREVLETILLEGFKKP